MFKGQDLCFKFQFLFPCLAFNFCVSAEFIPGINRNCDIAYEENCTVYCKDIGSQYLVDVNELETQARNPQEQALRTNTKGHQSKGCSVVKISSLRRAMKTSHGVM